MVACVKEELPQPIEPQQDGNKVTLTFGVQVPEAGSATRAMGSEVISRLDVIVFDNAGYFVDAVQATEVATDVPYDSNTKTFKVSLNSASRERRIHFVANADPAQIAAIKGHEDAAISSLVVSGTTDAYWQRMVYAGIGVDSDDFTAPAGFFGKDTRVIPLVRNYAKITVTDNNTTDAFTLTGYKVFNTRSQGSVAAYDEKVGQFVDFSKAPAEGSGKLFAAKSYSELANYTPLEKGELTSSAAYTTDPTYVRETSKNSPYIIIQGTYAGEEVYYKLDFILDGVGGKANILRNFEYNFVINAVTKKGTDEETAKNQTSGENGLSFDAGTQSLLNISDGVGQLFVNATTVVLVDGKPYDLKYKYIPAITSPNTTGNNQVKLTGFSGGKVINTFTPTTTEGIDTVDGWSTITITPNALPTAGFETQEVVLSTPSGLARTVKFILMQPYALTAAVKDTGADSDNNPKTVPAAIGQKVGVDVTIPSNVDLSLFPLEFVFETRDNSLSPDATANTMPVRTGASIISGNNVTTYGFVYTLTLDAYQQLKADAEENASTVTFTAHFRTSKVQSATAVYVYNKYFTLDYDDFENGGKKTLAQDITISFSGNGNRYGANNTATVTITVPDAPAGTEVSVDVEGFTITGTRAATIYKTNSDGEVKLSLSTTAWAGTRSVTVSCSATVDTADAIVTYNNTTASVKEVNKLYIAAGNIKWAKNGSDNQSIYLVEYNGGNVGNDKDCGTIGTSNKNKETSNSEKTFTVENLSETDKLYLRYRNDNYRRYSTKAITAKQAVDGYSTTLEWNDSTTRPTTY